MTMTSSGGARQAVRRTKPTSATPKSLGASDFAILELSRPGADEGPQRRLRGAIGAEVL
jgi:hypothetical protein